MAVRRDAYRSPIKPTCPTAFGVGWQSQGIACPSPEGRALLKPHIRRRYRTSSPTRSGRHCRCGVAARTAPHTPDPWTDLVIEARLGAAKEAGTGVIVFIDEVVAGEGLFVQRPAGTGVRADIKTVQLNAGTGGVA